MFHGVTFVHVFD